MYLPTYLWSNSMVGWPTQTGTWQTASYIVPLKRRANREARLQKRQTCDIRCSATTLSFGWVDRTDEVSVSGNGAAGAPLRQYRGAGGQYRGQERLHQPLEQPEERSKEPPASEQGIQEPNVLSKDVLKNARTMQALAQVLDGADLNDTSLAAAALVQVPYVMRNASGRLQRAAVAQHPLFGSLMQAALRAVPEANMQDLVAMLAALSELDDSTANVPCVQALSSAAQRLSASMESGTQLSCHLTCQIVASVAKSKMLQKDFKPLLIMSIAALEPQLDECRPQDLCVLASELCNLELYVEHAALIRTAVESAIPACRKLQGPELSCLAHACGVLQNVEKDKMMELSRAVRQAAPRLRPRNIIIVLHAFSQYDLPSSGLAPALAKALEPHLSGLSLMRFSMAMTALAKLGRRPQGSEAQHILAELDRRLEGADARSQASLFWAVSRMGLRPSAALLDRASLILQQQDMQAQASRKQSLLIPRNLSSIIWAWGTFGHAPAAMAFLLEAAEARMQQHNDQDVANLMSGLAACERPDLVTPGLMGAAERHACSIAASFSPQGLANTLWAFAKLKQPAPRLCEAAAAEILRRLSDFSMRDFSQMLWAFAKMGHKGSPIAVAAMAKHTAAIMKAKGAWAVRDVAQMTWALGVLEQPELPFLAACQQGVTRRMGKVSTVDAANLLWGYARLGAPPAPPAMYTHIARIGELANELAPHQLSTILWALGKIQAYPGIEIMETLVTRSRISLAEHGPQGISSMAVACATLRHHPGELLEAVAADVAARPSQYERDDWTNVVWALTRLGRSPGHLYALLAQEVDEGRIALDPRLMSTVIWSLAIFRAFESPLYDDILRGLAQWDVWDFEEDSLRRLYQAHLLSGALRRKAAASLPAEYLWEGRRAWLNMLHTDSKPSTMLLDVSDALTRIGLENEQGTVIGQGKGQGTFKMDILLRQLDKDGHPVAVEIISPHKMTRNTHQPVSRVLYRNACLKAWGYTIVSVLWFEWAGLGESWNAESRMLKEKHLLRLLTPVLHGEEEREKALSSVLTSELWSEERQRERLQESAA